MDNTYRKILAASVIVIILSVAFLIFLAVINEIIRAMLIGFIILIAVSVLAIWIYIKRILEEEDE